MRSAFNATTLGQTVFTMKTHSISQLSEQFPSDEWPHFLNVTKENNSVVLSIEIHPNIRWFTGHFPEQAVLAGVVQTHWAGEFGKYFFPLGEEFRRLDNLKFQSVILPKQTLNMSLQFDEEKHALKFKYYEDEKTYSEGKFFFEKAE